MATAEQVKELRERTGAGFMECKKALLENNDDVDKAITYLREKGIAGAAKKAGRAANEGKIHSYLHSTGKLGVLVEVNCETDFVARTDDFQEFVNNVALHIAAAAPKYLSKEFVQADDLEKEKAIFRAQALESGKPAAVVEKIVEGRIGKYYEESCLLQQKYVKEPEKTIEALVKEMIAKLGENIAIRRYVRFQVGEGQAKAE